MVVIKLRRRKIRTVPLKVEDHGPVERFYLALQGIDSEGEFLQPYDHHSPNPDVREDPFFFGKNPEGVVEWVLVNVDREEMMRLYNEKDAADHARAHQSGDADSNQVQDGEVQRDVTPLDNPTACMRAHRNGTSSNSASDAPNPKRRKLKSPSKRGVRLPTTSKWMSMLEVGMTNDSTESPKDLDKEGALDLMSFTRFVMDERSIEFKIACTMARNGYLVAGLEAFEDLAQAVGLWRTREDHEVIPPQVPLSVDQDGEANDLASLPRSTAVDAVLTSRIELVKQKLHDAYSSALRDEANEVMDMYRRRYVYSSIWQYVTQLEDMLKEQGKGSGRQGVGVSTMARNEAFLMLYGRPRGEKTHEDRQFSHMLNKAKRWYHLKKVFGIGIFVLLPRVFPRSWFESQLTGDQVEAWCTMLENCHEDLADMCRAVEDLVLSLFTAGRKRPDQLRLEGVANWDVIKRGSLLSYLQPVPDV